MKLILTKKKREFESFCRPQSCGSGKYREENPCSWPQQISLPFFQGGKFPLSALPELVSSQISLQRGNDFTKENLGVNTCEEAYTAELCAGRSLPYHLGTNRMVSFTAKEKEDSNFLSEGPPGSQVVLVYISFKTCFDLLCTERYIPCISDFLSCLCCKAFGITHPNRQSSPKYDLQRFISSFFYSLFSLNWKREGEKEKPKACGRLLWNVLPQALLCWLSSWLIWIPGMHYTGFFWKRRLIRKAMLLLDHNTGFMVFLKTIKLAQLTHTNTYRGSQCPISLARAKLHHSIRILKGLNYHSAGEFI